MSASSELAIRSIHLWLNERLKQHGLWCYDFASDISDGVLLYQLLRAEETPGLLASGSAIRSVGQLRGDGSRVAREANLQLVLEYIKLHGVETSMLEQMVPDIAGRTTVPNGGGGSGGEVEAGVEAEVASVNRNDGAAVRQENGEPADLERALGDSALGEEDEGAAVSSEVEAILLLVWKVFEHLRGRQALFGTPLPASPRAFATHMLVWAQEQASVNRETNPGFPTRMPGDLTTRFASGIRHPSKSLPQ